jgi:TIR domain
MRLLSTHVVRHSTGDKYLRLYHGDLTAIPAGEEVDLLVVSAFPGNYAPTPRSLIGALARRGVSVQDLSRDKEVDLLSAFSCWLSRDLGARFPTVGFRRVLCFETTGRAEPPQAVGDIFRAVMPFALGEPPIRSVAMPVLAAGNQGYDREIMLRAIFDAATHWLAAGLPLQTIKLVIYDPEAVAPLREAFDELARRAPPAPALVSARASGDDAPYHFFVSYAREDGSAVDALVQGLRDANPELRVFLDKLELDVGESWQAELDRAIESCRCVVAVYSPAYLASTVCIEEFNMARVRHRESPTPVLTPVYLRTAALPLYMRTLQYFDCREADLQRLPDVTRKLAAAPFR